MTRVTLTLEPELAAALRAAAAVSPRSHSGRHRSLSRVACTAFAAYLAPPPAKRPPLPRRRAPRSPALR